MSVINCSKCGNLFRSLGNNLCPDCLNDLEGDFKKVRRFLQDHPKSTISEIAYGTGLSEDLILKFVNSGRLMSRGSASTQCKICGKIISKGCICGSCGYN